MAKLFIACDNIDFIYDNTSYKAVFSKIVLDQKTIFRVDYTSQDDMRSNRYEVSYVKNTAADNSVQWITSHDIDKGLADAIHKEIEKNAQLLLLD